MTEQPSARPLPVPFLPAPCTDEILGSWLSRVAISNGIPSIGGLLKWIEVPKRLQRIVLADIVKPSESTLRLLEAFGLTYAECLAKFSTRPYWETMHAGRTNGEKNIPSTTCSIVRPPSLTFRGLIRISDKDLNQSYFKVCAACLHRDWHQTGCCYFHRSHQLWGSRVCHEHGLSLMSECEACRRPLGDVRSLLRISTHCTCGADLTANRDIEVHDSVWWRLAVFEHSCLHSPSRRLAGLGFLPFLREQVGKGFPGPGRASARRALEQTFGEDGTAWIRRSGRKHGEIRKLTLNVSFTQSTVRVYSALFVACGISFEAACAAVAERSENSGVTQARTVRRRAPRPKTVDEARERFTDFFSERKLLAWNAIRAQRPFVFWLLALHDLSWLESQLGPPRRSTPNLVVPSVCADRNLLYTDADLALAGTANGRIRHYAAVRAFYRDGEWLAISVANAQDARIKVESVALAERLRQVNVDFNIQNERPRRFTRRDAARGLRVSVKSLLSQANKYGIPIDLIEEDLWTFWRRAMEWSAMKRLSEGKSLAPTMVREAAGISSSVSNEWVKEVIQDFTKKLQ